MFLEINGTDFPTARDYIQKASLEGGTMMARTQLNAVLRHIHTLAGAPNDREPADRELLERFVERGEEAAFTVLVRRHGRLVESVCRHVLRHHQDAEDALQATFLVLARKAAGIRKREALASWLHGVAYRIALAARRNAARRRAKEKEAMTKPSAQIPPETAWRDVQEILDEEIRRLPENQRAPFIPCFLEGQSRAEAARELGWKEGTVSSRLARARQRLQKRLLRRGVSLSAVLGAAALTAPAGAAALPVSRLVEAALRPAGAGVSPAAIALADTLIRAMGAARRTAGALLILFLTVLLAGAGVLTQHLPGRPSPQKRRQTAPLPSLGESRTPPATEKRHGGNPSGDPLPPGAIGRIGTIRFRHGGPITCAAFAPNGKLLASGGYDNAVALWDVATGKEKGRLLGHRTGIEAVAFSQEGRFLASGGGGPDGKGGESRMIRVWDLATRKEIAGFCKLGLTVRSLAFSRDGKRVASAFADQSVRVWEVAGGKELLFLPRPGTGTIAALAPDASHAAWGCAGKTVVIHELRRGKQTLRRNNLPSGVAALAFTRDGKTLAVGGEVAPVVLLDARTGKQIGRFPGQKQKVKAVAFLPGGKILAAWHEGGTLCLWDRSTGKLVQKLPKRFGTAAFAPDGKTVALCDRTEAVNLWDFRKDSPACRLRAHEGGITSSTLGGDNKTLTTYSQGDRTVRRWDLGSRSELNQLEVGKEGEAVFFSIACSTPGKTLAAAGYTVNKTGALRPALWLVEAATGKRLHSLGGHRGLLRCAAFSPDGRTLASGGEDRSIFLWDVATAKQLRHLRGHEGGIGALAFSPDGSVLASAGNGPNDQSLRLWETSTGRLLHRIGRGYCDTGSVAFSPDGRTVAAATGEQPVRLWEVATGQERLTLARQPGWWIRCVAFSPDGNFLAGGVDNDVCLWSLQTGARVCRFPGHRGSVNSLAFLPDGATLISGSSDTTALLWDVRAILRAGRCRPQKLGANELASLGADLTGSDGARAYQALFALAAAPGQSLPLIKKRLRPVLPLTRVQERQAAHWIAALGNNRFTVRQQGTRSLAALGEAARPALKKALAARPAPEEGRRLVNLLAGLEGKARYPEIRALELLERIGTADAQRVLAALARGQREAWLTREAGTALVRVAKHASALRTAGRD
jgi:RNA polymerase sigma factor (sigma-70 family)